MTHPHSRRAICPLDCPDSCAMLLEQQAGELSLRGDPAHPITRGWLCAKMQDYPRWLKEGDRLATPLERVGPKGSGQFKSVSWRHALDRIARSWQDIINRHGAAAILPYSYGGTLGLLQNDVASSRFWNRLGASALQRSICGEAAKQAVLATLGARWAPSLKSFGDSGVIIVWGHNPVSTAPHIMPFLQRAHKEGTAIVVIDPKHTPTARRADLYLAPRPSTDGALALGLINRLEQLDGIDRGFLEEHALGWRPLLERARSFTLEKTAEITGIAAADIQRLAELLIQRRPALFKIADGLQRHENGGQTIRLVASLPAFLGHYGQPGGGLYYATSDYLRWDQQAVGHGADCVASPRTINMNRLGAALLGDVSGPPIESLYVFAANPMTSSPHGAAIAQGLARDDLFCVVHDLFLTDTARFADIVLPATSQLEHHDLHRAYGHRLLGYNAPALAPYGESKSNWDVMRALAAKMGFDEPWLKADGLTVLEEIFERTAATSPRLQGIPWERLLKEGSVPLSLPEEHVPFADGRYPTPSGKIELYSEAMADAGVDPLPDYVPAASIAAASPDCLVLISAAPHYFSNSTFGGIKSLQKKQGSPTVLVHPEDAQKRGFQAGELVVLENARGSITLEAEVSSKIRPGVAYTTKGHWAAHCHGGRNVNWITSDLLGDLGGQSTYQSTTVRVSKAPIQIEPTPKVA